MDGHQVTENLISILISILLSSIVISCFKTLEENGLLKMESVKQDDFSSQEYHSGLENEPIQQQCSQGYFRLKGMHQCRPLLDCEEIEADVRIFDEVVISYGPPRFIRLAKWNTKLVLHNVATLGDSQAFNKDLDWLRFLRPSRNVVQLIGYCDNDNLGKVFVTEYHRFGSALKVNELLIKNETNTRSDSVQRLRFCVSFAQLVHNLHQERLGLIGGTSDDADIILSRLIIAESPWRLVLNHFDFLKDFQNENSTFQNTIKEPGQWMDIYMAPKVCSMFLKGQDEKLVKNKLGEIHRKCRDPLPVNRPTSSELLRTYKDVLRKLEENLGEILK